MGQGESRERLVQEIDRVRRQERENATTELNNVKSQFQQELKKLSDSNSRREREQQEVFNKLQQQEKKCSSLVESLRSNLAETQQHLVTIDKLETHVLEEQRVSADRKRRAERLTEELESEKAGREEALAKISSLDLVIEATTKKLESEKAGREEALAKISSLDLVIEATTKKLESEKAGREEALAKISSLELVIEATTRDLDFERRRLKGAREGITLLETRLRAFCSTIEEIRHLFAKQQEKVEAMHKALALEEKENDETRLLVQGAQTTSNDTIEPGSVQS